MEFVKLISGEPEDDSGAFLVDVIEVASFPRQGLDTILWFTDGESVYQSYDNKYPYGEYSTAVKYDINGVGYSNVPELVRDLIKDMDLQVIRESSTATEYLPENC